MGLQGARSWQSQAGIIYSGQATVKLNTSWKRHFLASHILFAYLARRTTKNVFLISNPRFLFDMFLHCNMSHLE